MKAIVQRRYGDPVGVLALEDVGVPDVGPNEVLVRVRAASINPADWHAISGRPFFIRLAGYGLRRPKRAIPGSDVAGVVEAIGSGVTRLRPGDEVFGWCRGSLAEYAATPEDHLLPKPDRLTFEQAAAVPLAATTALQGLRDTGRLQSGQMVLVVGASGGVGTFAVQIAKALGAEVTGVCSTGNVEMVRSLGADRVVDYTSEDFTRTGQRFDLILQLAGTRSPVAFRRALRRNGTLVLSSGDGRFSGIDRILTATLASRLVSQTLVTWVARMNGEDLGTLSELVEAGGVNPVIDRTYALSETAAAVRYLMAGHARGKVVIAD